MRTHTNAHIRGLKALMHFAVSNEDSEVSDGRRRYGGGRRRRGDEDDTVLDNQDVSSVTSQDQGNFCKLDFRFLSTKRDTSFSRALPTSLKSSQVKKTIVLEEDIFALNRSSSC